MLATIVKYTNEELFFLRFFFVEKDNKHIPTKFIQLPGKKCLTLLTEVDETLIVNQLHVFCRYIDNELFGIFTVICGAMYYNHVTIACEFMLKLEFKKLDVD